MKLKNFLIGFIVLMVLLFLGLVAVVAFIFLSDTEVIPIQEGSPAIFTVLEQGTAADYGYAVFNYRGSGNVTALVYDSKPSKSITVIDDPQAIHSSRISELVEDLRELEKYGYEITVTNQSTIGNAIYVIPSGAIPSYALFNLQQGTSNGTIIYIGEKDLLLSRGIKRQEWYDALSDYQRSRIVQHNGTLDEFMESENYSLVTDILYQTWNQKANTSTRLSESGTDTVALEMNGTYMRLIYELDGQLYGIEDLGPFTFTDHQLEPSPETIYPWQTSTLDFDLNRTNGTAVLSIEKDGKVIDKEFLRRVSEGNVFIKKMQYEDPGDYIITVEDNDKIIASGLLHITDIDIQVRERHGLTYVFSVMVDGEPLESADVLVGLGESEKRKLYVSNGELAVNAQLDPGPNVFNIEIYGGNVQVTYDNSQEGFFDIYLKYGLPGVALVFIVYFGARLSRKPMYRLRFGESATSIRQEIRIPSERAVESFKRIREDMNIGKAPITPLEFAISLKRYLTNGADVTEGNVEEILKTLTKKGRLEGYNDYYQLKGEGDVKRNALRRMVREKLIENGTMFRDEGGKFVTKDFEIGFFGQTFNKKALIVVDSSSEANRILSSLDGEERARIKVQQANDMIKFVTIDKLSDVL